MINKQINGIKYIKKKIGGDETDTKYDLNKNIYVVYNLFSYLLLYISYILFCIATIIFLNASLNLNFKKAEYDDYEKEKNGKPIYLDKPIFIDQPIFEYLKPNNFMYIDDYLLDKNSAIFITIISILSFSIVAIAIIFGIINSKIFGDIDNPIKDVWNTLLFQLACITYIFIFIIIIIYNENKKNNYNIIKDNEYYNKINYSIYEGNYKETYLRNLKNKIINILENGLWDKYITNVSTGLAFFDDKDKKVFASDLKKVNKVVVDGEDGIQNILKILFLIYKDGYEAISRIDDKDKIKRLKDYKIKYIKHINDYFELLIRDKINDDKNDKDDKDDFYKKYYIFGLANKYSTFTKFNDSINSLFVEIAKKIKSYFIVIIVLYLLLFLIITPMIIYHNKERETVNFIIDSLYYFNINFKKIILIFFILAFISYFILYYNKSV